MSKRRKSIRQVFILFLAFITIVMSCVGCSKKKQEKKASEIYLYYTDKNQTKLTYLTYSPKKTATLDVVEEVLGEMNKTSTEPNMVTAKPENVNIYEYEISDKMLTINFSTSYQEMNRVTELLCRSAIVLTMTQIKGIDYVAFTIDGGPLLDSAGNPVGSMKASDFVDNGESNINSFQKIRVELYFADSTGKKLEPVTYEGICEQNTSVEKLIIEKLIEGPSLKQYQRTLPSGLRLNSVLTKDGICYVNFDSTFLTESVDVSAELELYSIVNSLSELSYINKVQISVNGETNKKLRDEISLEYAFSRNLDLLK